MQQSHQSYYQPYLSDSEDSDSSSISSTDLSADGRNPIGSTDSLRQAGAVSNTVVTQITDRIQPKLGNSRAGLEYSTYDISGVINIPSGTKFDTTAGTYTSILMINSLDRDRNVYAQPTFFTIRLPRTYRNVSQFSITQMKLLSSFYYFRPDKENVSLQVVEQGRTIVANGQTVDNVITVTLRTGSYDITTLLAELQLQLNRTPLFFYFPNGINDFITLFTAAGDLSVGFNQPGDNYYNSLKSTFIANPTMTQIVTTYFPSTNANLNTFTYGNVLIAYYYPVLYEQVNDPAYVSKLTLTLTTSTLLPGETVTSRILYTFQGLGDPVILELINTNITILDTYRTLNTFLYSLVNEYSCTYATNNNNISISTNQLNTSLYNLITNQTTIALANQLNLNGLTTQQYSNLQASNLRYNAVFTDMYNRMQKSFATNFGVNFGTYSATFYTNVSNVLFIQNGIGATGVTTGYSLALLQSGVAQINSSTQSLQDSPGYWPQLSTQPPANHQTDLSSNVIFIGSGIRNRYSLNPSYIDISGTNLNVPYNTLTQTIQTTTNLIDNSGNIYMNPSFGAGDCVTPIYNSGYTVFRFRSFVRQTLQVETLPLPYYYRTPRLNQINFGAPISTYFDLSYNYINNPQLTRTDISSVALNYGMSYSDASNNARDFILTVQTPVKYYSFRAPKPSVNDASGYKYNLTFSIQSDTASGVSAKFASPISAYFYHDQGAFFADISGYRSENPYNYLQTVSASTDVSGVTFTANVIAGDTYYLIVRSQDVSFTNTRIKIFAYYPNTSTTPFARYNYDSRINPYNTPTLSFPVVTDVSYNQIWASLYDTDFIKLPTASNLQGNDPSSAVFNQFLPITEFPIGYDSNGVSTDLTDYRGYQSNAPGNRPAATFRVDPINQYTFQNISPYNTTAQSYFYANSANALLKPLTNTLYTPTIVAQREYKIVHWYDQQYIAPQIYQSTPTTIASIPSFTRVIDASYGIINGYSYTASTITTSNGLTKTISTAMNFDQGVIGIGFLPTAATWEIDQVIFKTAYMESAGTFSDPNSTIRHLAVFPTTSITGSLITDISMNQALYILDRASTIQYTPSVRQLYGGFDTVGGTYHQYRMNSNFVSPLTQKITGFTPSNTYLFDSNAYYSIIPFDSNGNIAQFYTLMGSYIPYPNVSKPVLASSVPAASTYYTTGPPSGNDFYIPSPLSTIKAGSYSPTDANLFQSRYEQSLPIQTSLLHTQSISDPIDRANAFKKFVTYSLNYGPDEIPAPGTQLVLCNITAITHLNSGPYFFITNSESYYLQDIDESGNPYDVRFYFGSNYNIDFNGVRGYSNIFSNTLIDLRYTSQIPTTTPNKVSSNGNQLDLFLGITTNTKGSNYLDNLFVLTLGSVYYYNVVPPQLAYTFEFIFSKYDATTRLTPIIYNSNASSYSPILVSNVLSNGVTPTLTNYTWYDSVAYAFVNFSYTIDSYNIARHKSLIKLNYTNNNLLFFQFQTINRTAYPVPYANSNTSYFCMYDSNTSRVVNFFPTNGFIFPLNTFNYSEYVFNNFTWNSNLPTYANTSFIGDPFNAQVRNGPSPSNLYLDWTVDSTGNLFVLNLVTDMSQYYNISYYKILSNQGGNYPTQINFNTGIRIVGSVNLNSGIYQKYGYGLFNQIKIDANSNIYLQQQFDIVSQNCNIPWSSNQYVSPGTGVYKLYTYPQLQYAWTGQSNGLWGHYAKIYVNRYQTLLTTSGDYDTLFSVNSQPSFLLNGTTLSGNISDMILGNQSNTLGNPSLFLQVGKFGNIYSDTNIPWQVITLGLAPNVVISQISGFSNVGGSIIFNYSYSNKNYSFTYTFGGDINNLRIQLNENFLGNNVPYYISSVSQQFGFTYFNNVSIVPAGFMYSLELQANYLFTVDTTNVILYGDFGQADVTNPTQWPISTQPYGTTNQSAEQPYISPTTITQTFQLPSYGYSASGIDLLALTACNAWQIMYPSVKIVMKKLQSSASPITNTTDLTTYPSYAHTAMFYYDNYADLSNDIFNKFGSEKKARFKNYDVSSGYGFNSYIPNIPLNAYTQSTNDICGNTGYNYLAVRGYSPTEKFDCLTRFYLPGQYNFGFMSLRDISNETQTVLVDLSNSPLVNQTYATTLGIFNSNFIGNFTYGSNVIPGFPGSNYTFTGFGSFLAKYISIYNANIASAALLASINSNVTASVSEYIKYYLTPILPAYVQTRARFTDPLLFSILFKSALTPQFAPLEDEWGLGWNLGYPKVNTAFNTIQRAPSFFKILDDYIFLKLNKEFTMNRMDSSAKENLAITHEPQGQTNQYAAKLLLSGFGAYAQTMIQNPITFNPVLTSMDKLTFQWTDPTNTQINNADCEWNAVVQINEQVTQATVTSTIPKAN